VIGLASTARWLLLDLFIRFKSIEQLFICIFLSRYNKNLSFSVSKALSRLFLEKSIEDVHLGCHSQCPNECIKTYYSITKSSVNIGNEDVFTYIKNVTSSMKNKTVNEIQRYFR